MRFSSISVLGGLIAPIIAWTCTEGVPWTPSEFEEYLTLNDTTGWKPMEHITHCYAEDSDSDTADFDLLDARAGGNKFIAYSQPSCAANSALRTVLNFGCGGCYTTDSAIQSGYLWRETTGNPYPTVDYFSGTNCVGSVIHHQGVLSGRLDSCDPINSARSFVTYQGC